ncbi:MAG: hypothetical protein U0984_19225, partial [Prosthecobacter sp.]|nr:hypothetical protein [Prosthecobacter sp.]
MKTTAIFLAAALFAELTVTPTRAAWTLSADPAAMRPLPSQWQQYFGIHYGTAAGYDGPWFQTVRSYGAPNMGLPRNADGTLNTAALTGTPVTGPFLGETYAVGPQDIRNSNVNSPGLDTLVPDLLANGLTTIYPTPNLFFSPQPVNQDLAYVTLRSVYGAFPDAATQVLWQWGNEINGKNWDPSLTDTPPNQTSQVPFYAEAYFARGIEALQRVSQDLYGDSQRIPVMSGSFANIYNVNYRNWMRDVLNYQITGTYAPTLVDSPIWQHVDILTVHYPFSAGKSGGAVMQEMWDEWIVSGKIPSLWVTEDHGQQGGGPSTVLARGMRYLDWIATNGANAEQTRLGWWGTDDPDDPGGQAIEAVNLLGQVLAGTNIRQRAFTLDGAEIFLVGNGDAGNFTRLTIAIIPPGAEEANSVITPVDPGTITLTLPAGGLANVGPATAVQYSQTELSQTWTPAVSVVGQSLQITVGRAISSPVLISVPLAFSVSTPPAITTQPANQTVTIGQTATFTVAATGSPTYQWQKNGVVIPGATGASYTTPSTVLADNGALFSVVVSNSGGSVTSGNATLTVNITLVLSSVITRKAQGTLGNIDLELFTAGSSNIES